jgi:hypothetical protein
MSQRRMKAWNFLTLLVFSFRLAVGNRETKNIFIPRYKKLLSCEHSKKYLNVATDNIFNEIKDFQRKFQKRWETIESVVFYATINHKSWLANCSWIHDKTQYYSTPIILPLSKCVRDCLISYYYNIPLVGISKHSAFSPHNVLLWFIWLLQ